jgi:phosphatidylinositol alpha-1,6-mannosyltransferase
MVDIWPPNMTHREMYERMRDRLVKVARQHLPPTAKRGLRRLQRSMIDRRGPLKVAQAALRAGDYSNASRFAELVLRRQPQNLDALQVVSTAAVRRGAIVEGARYAVKRAAVSRDRWQWRAARSIVGRVRETDERWQPIVAASSPAPPLGSRITYLAKESRPFLHNGFCTRTHECLQALSRAGRDVSAVTMPGFPGSIGVENPPSHSVVEDVTYRHLLPRGGPALSALALDEYIDLSTQVLAGLVARLRPALLHIGSGHRGFETALVGNAVARWAGIPWLYEVRSFFETTWTSDHRYMEHGEYYQRRLETETRMMRAADLVVTLSGPMRDEIADRHGIPEEKIRIVPNAVDLSRFRPQPRNEDLRRQLGLAGSFTLGYVSNLSHPREGQEVLIEAIAYLRRQGRPVCGLLVGDGTRRPDLERLAARLGLSKSITFAGSIPFDLVPAYYSLIDLFVVPRVNERAARMVSPMKPFEAMAMRIPVLVSDLPALIEISGTGERAALFRAGDAASLASAAMQIMDAPEQTLRRVDVASDWVRRQRSWTAVANGFAEVYDELLSRVHGSPLTHGVEGVGH